MNHLGRFVAIGALVALGGVGGLRGAIAQGIEPAHPAHIHAGSCPAPGEVVAPLSNVGEDYPVDGTPTAGSDMVGQETAVAVDASVTTVPIAMADLIATGHAIVVHKSVEEIGTYVACGDIGGMLLGASDLPIGLGELNHSGYSGIAWLHDNGDGTTTVHVFLNESSGAEEGSGDHDQEAASAVTGTQVDVALNEFTITTSMPTLKAGETYTFVATNVGKLPHEMVVEKAGDNDIPLEMGGKELEVEDVAPGTSKSLVVTFDTPGKYQLACHVPDHYEDGMVIEFEVTA